MPTQRAIATILDQFPGGSGAQETLITYHHWNYFQTPGNPTPLHTHPKGGSIACTCGGAHDRSVLVHSLQELANDQRDALDSLHLLLGVQELFLEVLLLILDVLLLDLQEL